MVGDVPQIFVLSAAQLWCRCVLNGFPNENYIMKLNEIIILPAKWALTISRVSITPLLGVIWGYNAYQAIYRGSNSIYNEYGPIVRMPNLDKLGSIQQATRLGGWQAGMPCCCLLVYDSHGHRRMFPA